MGNAIYRKDGENIIRVRNLRHKTSGSSPYQQWNDTYLDSPILTVDYPYQCIVWGAYAFLLCSSQPIYIVIQNVNELYLHISSPAIQYRAGYQTSEEWIQIGVSGTNWRIEAYPDNIVLQANYDIYNDISLTTVYFQKNTNETDIPLEVRDKGVWWKEKIAAGYQEWDTYPPSPITSDPWKYQILTYDFSSFNIFFSTTPFYVETGIVKSNSTVLDYRNFYGVWQYQQQISPNSGIIESVYVQQSNHDVYELNMIDIAIARTTTEEQNHDPEKLHRINI